MSRMNINGFFAKIALFHKLFFLLSAFLFVFTISHAFCSQENIENTIKIIPLPEKSTSDIPFISSNPDQNSSDFKPIFNNFKNFFENLNNKVKTEIKLNSKDLEEKNSTLNSSPSPQFFSKKQISKYFPKNKALLPVNSQTTDQSESVKIENSLEVKMRSVGTPRQIKVIDSQKIQNLVENSEIFLSQSDDKENKIRIFLNNYKTYLRINDPNNEFVFDKSEKDDLQRQHFRFKQFYKGLPVWPGELIVHLDTEGNIDLLDGAYVPTPYDLTTTPDVTAEEAIAAARAYVSGGDKANTGQPELIIYGPLDQPAHLAWKLELKISISSHWVVMVDALNQQVITAFNMVKNENVVGSGQDLFGDSRKLNVWHEGSLYYLVDTSKPMFDPLSDPPSLSTTSGAISIIDLQHQESINNKNIVTSTASKSGWLRDGVSAAVNVANTYDYYRLRHGRNSIDNYGSGISTMVRYKQNYSNAFWSSNLGIIVFGDALPYAGALDVVAHEITHGVTDHTANLLYQNQSGALNEAFSDIFGQNVETFVTGTTDWLHGNSLGEPDRNLKDPSSIIISGPSIPYPSKMSEYVKGSALNYFVDQDYGGVHINSSIINHAYYYLVEGLNGAIGITDSERIFYRALTTHLTMQSEFIDARLACIQSAKEIFGSNSVQATKTAEAFDAVEIFDSTPTPTPDPSPVVEGSDAALFVSFDPNYWSYRLARRETVSDGTLGSWLSHSSISPSRPSVTADGDLAAFVTEDQDLCLISTDGSVEELCLGVPDSVHSVAISPDGTNFGFVLLDQNGNPDNQITVINPFTNEVHTYSLVAPASEGVTINSVESADTIVFSADNRFLIYDALNVLKMADGSESTAWSIYAIDLVTEKTLIVVPPMQNLNIGFPALGHTSQNFITFEAMSKATGNSTIYAGNLGSGALAVVGSVAGDFGVPSYTGDDRAIVYSILDNTQRTGHSTYKKPLASDHITPSGNSSLWLKDSDFTVIYRRGAYHKITVENNDIDSGTVISDVGGISCGDSCSYIYPSGTTVTLTARTNTGSNFVGWGGVCSGTGTCKVVLNEDQAVTATFSDAYTLSGTVLSGSSDGPPISGATVSIAGKTATTAANGTFSISGIATGTYTLKISASGYTAYTNSSYVVTSNQSGQTFVLTSDLPNLMPYKPSTWNDKIVVLTSSSGTTDSSPLYSADTLYINRAILNKGNAAISTSFKTILYVDDIERYSWFLSSLSAGYYNYLNSGYAIGKLCEGTHTVKIVVDSSNSIAESNESDNSYTKTITILPSRYKLSGIVYWGSISGSAISGATVSIAGKTSVTDANGAFSISDIASGTYTLTISASGYDTYTNSSYAVTSNQINASFFLMPSAPTLTSTVPASGTAGVALNGTISATFSKAMQASSINNGTFCLNNGMTGKVTYNASTYTATLTPSTALSPSTTYTATITTGVKDTTGTALSADKSWSFTTLAVPPTITSTSPAAGTIWLPLNTAVKAVFSKAMTTSSINSGTFSLNNGVSGTVTYDDATYTATFTPSSALASNTTYTATITTGVKDTTGTALSANKSWSFTTMPDQPAVIINKDAEVTKSTSVTLALNYPGATSMRFSTNNSQWAAWETLKATRTYTLATGDGLKTIYVRFKNASGTVSPVFSDSIILDATAPTGQVVINNGDPSTKNLKVTLQLNAADKNAVAAMQFSNNGKTWSVWEDFAAGKDWKLASGKDGVRTVSVKFKDVAGNVSAAFKDTITLDTTAPALTITTTAFTTSLTGKVISGAKEAGATVGVQLNDDALDDSLITQTLAGTTWKAWVKPFAEKSNVITVTATDAALNETVKTLAATYKPFVVTDLSGPWFYIGSGFEPGQYDSWTGYGLLTVADTELYTEDFSDEVGFTGTYTDDTDSGTNSGTFRFDSGGLLSGNTLFQGDPHDIATGKMDDNRSMVTMLVNDANNEMITAVKKGSGFLQSHLTGTWYVYGVSTSPDFDNSVEWGTLVFDGTGKITSGSFTHVLRDETSTTITYPMSGTTKVASDGGLSGSMSLTYQSKKYSTPYAGQMSTQKNMALLRSSAVVQSIDVANKMVLVKGGGSFATADLTGRWRFEGIYNSMTHGELYSGYIDIAGGKLTGGEINGEALVAGTGFAISSAGVITPSGNLKTAGGATYVLKTGKMDSKKRIMVLRSGISLIIGYAER